VKKKLLRVIIITLALCMLIPLTLFAEGAKEKGEKGFVVGHSMVGRWALVFVAGEYYLQRGFSEKGVRMITAVAESDTVKQAQDIEDFIARGVDALLVLPIDQKAIVASIQRAKEAGIPLVTYNRPSDPESDIKEDAFSGQDSFIQAYDAAVELEKILRADGMKPEDVRILHILGHLRDQNAVNRKNGFEKAANEFDWKIIAEVPSEWNPDKTLPQTTNALVAHPEINTIFLASDFLIEPVVAAMKAQDKWHPRGHGKHIYFASQDVNPNCIDRVRDGYIDTNTLWDVKGWCYQATDYVQMILEGNPPKEPFKLMRGVTTTQENIDELGPEKVWGMEFM
jgi:ABC-type sugar transport system substrate-binding protein